MVAVNATRLNRFIADLSRLCDESWDELKRQLLNRHLIVSHLIDALPDSSMQSSLSSGNERARATLATLDPATATQASYVKLANHQREFQWALHDAMVYLDSNSSLAGQKTVVACVHGIQESNQSIKQAKSTYNTAAIAYNEILLSRWVRWFRKLENEPRRYHDIAIGWPDSATDEPSGIDSGVDSSVDSGIDSTGDATS